MFKAVWQLPCGYRVEWYPHIRKAFLIRPMEGCTELLWLGYDDFEAVFGSPTWM